jgi:UDP-N-acetylglucosamine 1-carboxyvinyltransferase
MDTFIVKSGNKLEGTVKISGAKNSSLALMAAAMMTDEKVILKNVPELKDIFTMIELLKNHGVKVNWNKENKTIEIQADIVTTFNAPYEIVKKMRASIYVLAPLLARFHKAHVSLPGGCVIGARPVEVHLRAMKMLGADVEVEGGYINAEVKNTLKGNKFTLADQIYENKKYGIKLVKSSHTGTSMAIMAATLAEGESIIDHCAREPEVDDLIEMLNKMGAKIKRDEKTPTRIHIKGVKKLHGTEHTVLTDRIVAGTYAAAAAITNGKVEIINGNIETLSNFHDLMVKAGVKISQTEKGFLVDATNTKLKAVGKAVALPYPALVTDLQAIFMTLMTIAEGTTTIIDAIYENRLMYTSELKRMGANIHIIDDHTAEFIGVNKLTGADVMASDLRAGASLVLAGLVAEGTTTIHRVYHLYRGYEYLIENLNNLGTDIKIGQDNLTS